MQLKIHMLTIEDLVPAHRPGGNGKIFVDWLFVRHPIGAANRTAVCGQ